MYIPVSMKSQCRNFVLALGFCSGSALMAWIVNASPAPWEFFVDVDWK